MGIQFLTAADAREADCLSETAEEFYTAVRPMMGPAELKRAARWLAWKSGEAGQKAEQALTGVDPELGAELEALCVALFQAAQLFSEFSQSKEP